VINKASRPDGREEQYNWIIAGKGRRIGITSKRRRKVKKKVKLSP
jgi:hypothetical protein